MTRIAIVDTDPAGAVPQELCAALNRSNVDVRVVDSPAAAAHLLSDSAEGAVVLKADPADEALLAAADLTREYPGRLVLVVGPDSSVLVVRRVKSAAPAVGEELPVALAVQRALGEEEERLECEALVERLQRMACTDSLTGVSNRAHLDELCVRELHRAERYGAVVSIAMLDIDDFKRINDTFGHQMGDRALQAVGSVLRGNVRATDVVARYGGDEFVILMPETSAKGARSVLDRISEALESYNAQGCLPVALRLSIGLGTSETDQDPLGAADRLMYEEKRAKKAGR
jgi:diguanylate cyclase (GGDEF)-like protein